jgi:hypothetical protein
VVVIHRKRWSPLTGNPGRHGPVRALDTDEGLFSAFVEALNRVIDRALGNI